MIFVVENSLCFDEGRGRGRGSGVWENGIYSLESGDSNGNGYCKESWLELMRDKHNLKIIYYL